GIRDATVTGVQTCALPIFPREGERRVHGNASVSSAYFERALGMALAEGAGLAFLHSHTRRSRGWQEMSCDDLDTEELYAPRALEIGRASCRERVESTRDAG